MREMKDSGVEWIGEMPAGWKTARVKNVAATMQSGGTPDSSNDSFYVDKEYGIPWVAIADMSATAYVTDTNKYISEDARYSKNLKVFPPGTILYAMYASVGKVAELAVPATINQALLAIELRNNINNSFFKYALNAWEPYIISESNGTTQNNLNASKVANLFVPLPCLQEQEILARLLDLRRTKVDTLIQNVQTQIEKLKTYKQSLITEVVTKGLDPTVPMKDSGVEWIGEIPEHWSVAALKYFTDILPGYAFSSNDFHTEAGVPLLRGVNVTPNGIRWEDTVYWNKEITDNLKPFILQLDDIVVGLDRPWISEGTRITRMKGKDLPSLLLQRVCRIRVKGFMDSSWVFLWIASNAFKESLSTETTGISVPHISTKQIGDFIVAIPPIEVQKEICEFIDAKCSQIDRLIAIKQAKIEKLEQYKRSLIYEYVTGKKEVV